MVDIPNELLERLHDVADQRGMSIETLLNQFLSQHQSATVVDLGHCDAEKTDTENAKSICKARDQAEPVYPPGSLARFTQLAVQAGMASNVKVDTSARSREILSNEFADHIDRRIRK